ncbi:MAG: 2-oxoglutarate dehydrogenase E1 component [Candidatus Hydrogenedentes bacterium]|nr:2-oxoglutarate dehydrogenase E1 component [Candidatus Hydrogenedentota bacterium]
MESSGNPSSNEGIDPSSLSLAFIESIYEDYLRDPNSVSEEWRGYFRSGNGGVPAASTPAPEPIVSASYTGDKNPVLDDARRRTQNCNVCGRNLEITALQYQVDMLIRNYRIMGHKIARIDPLGMPRPRQPELDPAYLGFRPEDMDIPFLAGPLSTTGMLPLRQIIQRLRSTYCRSIGVQFMHIDDLSIRQWLCDRMEGSRNRISLSREQQIRILTRLTDAVIFEEFIQKKFVGAKRFSLEGGESLIPLLDLSIEKAGESGLTEIVIGMAHRGRLNVLANIMGKSPRQIFREFADKSSPFNQGRGDVKYHLGHHTEWVTQSGKKIHLALAFNPSHLEFVNPVVLGRVRAHQDRTGDLGRSKSMALLIHGDASFAGEGIVQETLNLSELEGYTTGGTLHVIVNNQIGFTTNPSEGRSSVYATDVAKMLQSPIFHVNGEDSEAVAQVVNLAMEFRHAFRRDVVIDMYCYRRRGHNEGDEPSFTQPVLYRTIESRKSVREGYLEHLLTLGGVTRAEAEEIAVRRREVLEAELTVARTEEAPKPPGQLKGIWSAYKGGPDTNVPDVDTGVPREKLCSLLEKLTHLTEDIHPHPKLERILESRREIARDDKPVDWAAAEALAFASLATEGTRVRLSGQDSGRGTFSHRHAIVYDIEDGQPYISLQHLDEKQAAVEVYNSPLSEAGVLGFEYGYSIACPDGLVLWEAQFGDFFNAAQVIIDQFISSAEDKWGSLSGLVMLLPHGYEGMGPEHSSARTERFFSLAAEDNMQVVIPSTPAQFFHLLRRQIHRPWRKPLVAMTPKSLLRHPSAVSKLDELTHGRFQRIIPDGKGIKGKVDRVLMCSGKVYYELAEEREKSGRNDVAIVRIEQLYPLQPAHLQAVLEEYPEGTDVVWVQEEPRNMGAWRRMQGEFGYLLLGKWPFHVVSRPESASPATGSSNSHKAEQKMLLEQAFGPKSGFMT